MTHPLRILLQEHKQQFEADPTTTDRFLLEQGRQRLLQYLSAGTLEQDTAHLGFHILFLLDDRPGIVALMKQYLQQPLSIDEEAWARWQHVDYLAALAYPQGGEPCQEVVTHHQAFLDWSRQHLSLDRLIWVMYDGTQAVCWRLAGKAEAWLTIFHELMTAVPPTPENRYDRFIYLRTATAVLNVLERLQEALAVVRQMHLLCDEDTYWERAFEVRTNAYASEIDIYHTLGNIGEVRRLRFCNPMNTAMPFQQRSKRPAWQLPMTT